MAAGAGVVNSSGTALVNHGTLAGTGDFSASLKARVENHGTLSPGGLTLGDTFGTLRFDSLTLADDSLLKIEIGNGGEHDVLELLYPNSNVLGGTLALWNMGYAPVLGDSFVVLSHTGLAAPGGFDALELHGFGPGVSFDLIYGDTTVSLQVTAVPEPGTWALWLSGWLALLGPLSRRRRQAHALA